MKIDTVVQKHVLSFNQFSFLFRSFPAIEFITNDDRMQICSDKVIESKYFKLDIPLLFVRKKNAFILCSSAQKGNLQFKQINRLGLGIQPKYASWFDVLLLKTYSSHLRQFIRIPTNTLANALCRLYTLTAMHPP